MKMIADEMLVASKRAKKLLMLRERDAGGQKRRKCTALMEMCVGGRKRKEKRAKRAAARIYSEGPAGLSADWSVQLVSA